MQRNRIYEKAYLIIIKETMVYKLQNVFRASSGLCRCDLRSTELSYLTYKIESVQYNTVLAIMSAIRRTSREKLYQDLGFESLKDKRRWLCYPYTIVSTKQPDYLYDLIPPFQRSLRNKGCILPNCVLKILFLSYAINKWN